MQRSRAARPRQVTSLTAPEKQGSGERTPVRECCTSRTVLPKLRTTGHGNPARVLGGDAGGGWDTTLTGGRCRRLQALPEMTLPQVLVGKWPRQPRDRKKKRSSRAERSRESVGQPGSRPSGPSSGTLKRPGLVRTEPGAEGGTGPSGGTWVMESPKSTTRGHNRELPLPATSHSAIPPRPRGRISGAGRAAPAQSEVLGSPASGPAGLLWLLSDHC